MVLHLGGGEWAVIDSCIDRKSKRPVALDYLNSLGIQVSDAVKLFVVTHWHDDHIRGASQILREARSAKFVCSNALRSLEFLRLTGAGSGPIPSHGVVEFAEIFRILEERLPSRVRKDQAGPDAWAASNLVLFERTTINSVPAAHIRAMSPSAAAVTLAKREIGQLLPQEGAPKRAIQTSANDVAVALQVRIGNLKVILGSDLQANTDQGRGWRAAVIEHRSPDKARIYKVPHHGSKNADHIDIWNHLLDDQPFAAVTPFASGSVPLPTESDLNRLISRTANLFCTSAATSWSPRKRAPAVERTLKEVVRQRRVISGPMGQVRFRCRVRDGTENISVALFGGALQVNAA